MKLNLLSITLLVIITANIAILVIFLFSKIESPSKLPSHSAFNNIASPLIALLSLFVYYQALSLTTRQNEIMVVQSKIAHSETLRPLIEYEFESIKAELARDLREQNDFGRPFFNAISVLPIFSKITEGFNTGTTGTHYAQDWNDWEVGVYQDLKYFRGRSYYNDLDFLYRYSIKNMKIYDRVEILLSEIDAVALTPEFKVYYKRRIRDEFLREYFHFFEVEGNKQKVFPTLLYEEYVNGVLHNNGGKIRWTEANRTPLAKNLLKFKNAVSDLSTNKNL